MMIARRLHRVEPPFDERTPRRHQAGVALVIVLAFVLLLSGVILAFFSHSTNELQVSNSSANQVKADLIAQGALDTIVGDFKQEIAAGSASPAATPAAGVTLYVPKLPLNAIPARDPALVGKAGYENLIKRSSTAQPYTNNAANQAAGPSTLTPALSGQYISPSRWNYHLLLQKDGAYSTNAAVFTPTGATTTSWSSAPEWVVVKRTEDLGNPTIQWNDSLKVGGSNPVVGRYAYAVYDEGGLLDINAAGYPSPVANAQYRSSLAFADLKQLPGIGALPPGASSSASLTQNKFIDNLVGLRNYATAAYNPTTQTTTPISGNFPVFTWSATNATNYFNFFQSASNGFLTAANSPLVTQSKAVSDHPFLTRQEFMRIALQYITTTDADRATVEDAFQCLGTFSRTLNQPSYIRPQAVDSTSKLDYNAAVPKILAVTAGGNEAAGADNKVNPSFLAIRASAAFTRNDNVTKAVVGEPLVKKRFPLIYLSWLTYAGPSAQAVSAAQQALLNAGIPQAIINQGTVQNIQKYFGLKWTTITCPNGDTQLGWQYLNGVNGGSGRIMTLAEVAAAGQREPDFFELLKATINAGSLAKTYRFYDPNASNLPGLYEAERDSSIDAQIMQIGANIIDQFDADSYPTCISFNDGSLFGGKAQVYRGVEDLPYIYRVREAKIMITDSGPADKYAQNMLPKVVPPIPPSTVAVQPPEFTPGEGAVFQEPEIWNPHGWNGSATPVGAVPNSFRVVALLQDPTGQSTPSIVLNPTWRMYAKAGAAAANRNADPITIGALADDQDQNKLQFNIPNGRQDLFREPTLLVKTGVPDGSGLGGGTAVHALYPAGQYLLNGVPDNDQNFLGILLAKVPMAWFSSAQNTIPASGITLSNPPTSSAGIVPTGFINSSTSKTGLTWRLQYLDNSGASARWITYDEKFCVPINANNYGTPNNNSDPNGTALPNYINKTFNRVASKAYGENIIGSELSQLCFDPRTSRFGMIYAGRNGNRGNAAEDFPVCIRNTYGPPQSVNAAFSEGWSVNYSAGDAVVAAGKQNALLTTRPDELQGFISDTLNGLNLGYAYDLGPVVPGWNPAGASAVLRPGMYAQNNPETAAATNPKRFFGDKYAAEGAEASTLPPVPNQFYGDADNVVRRAMSAFVPVGGGNPATVPASGVPSGLPFKPTMNLSTASASTPATRNTSSNEYASRPIVLNRPFRSVAELGCVFSGTPWKNLDFSTPESGDLAMLDVFSLFDTDDAQMLVAGRVNLNTRQGPVLKAILVGAYKDEFGTVAVPSTVAPPLTAAEVDKIASDATTGLPAWTSNTTDASKGPLANVTDLVGRWQSSVAAAGSIYGAKSYSGYIGTGLTSALTNDADKRVERFREASVRALASTGQTRVWNLLIDVVAQAGRYPGTATKFDQFAVEGEQRCWLHVAIDRLTGQVIDRQLEIVKE